MDILAVGAHPDDIEFGCGGTLLKYARSGYNVHLLVLTAGNYGGDTNMRIREEEAAAKFLGAKSLFWGGFQDTELSDNRDLIWKIEEAIRKVNPHTVFLNFPDDVHQDHRAASSAGMSASRYIREVLFFEVPTTRNFEPGIFVDIGNILNAKLELLSLHASQVDKTRVEKLTILESAQACATFRGFQGRVKYAEGFKSLRVLREIV